MAGPLDVAYVEIIPDFDKFPAGVRRGVNKAGRQIQRELSRSLGQAEAAAGRSGQQIGESLVDGIGESLEQGLRRDVNGRLRDANGRFVSEGGDGGRRTGSAFGSGFSDGLSSTLSSIAGIRLPTAGFAIFGSALAAAAASAAQLAAAMAPAAGIIAALPAATGAAAAGISTLNLALLGVSEAFELAVTGTAEEFEEAIENLAPAAQEAANVVRELAPALTALQDSVQQSFFEGMATGITQAADALLGPFQQGASEAARLMGDVADSLLNVAASSAGVEFVNSSFASLNTLLATVAPTLDDLFASLLNLGTAVNEAFGDTAGQGIAGLVTRLTDFINAAVESGRAVEWVEDALAVFQALGDIISPLVGIVVSFGRAASTTGENALGVFGELLQTFDDFLASAEGQDVLISLFEALNTVGDAFATVLGNIAPALPPIIDGIGDILSVVAPLLGPLSELVGNVLTALAPVLSAVARAIDPLIAPLNNIVVILGQILVQALNTLMPFIEEFLLLVGDQAEAYLTNFATLFESLAPAVFSLLEALGPLLEALLPLLELFSEITVEVLNALVPAIEGLAEVITWLVDNVIVAVLVPILEFLINLMIISVSDAIDTVAATFESAGVTITDTWEAVGEALQTGYNFIRNQVFVPIRNAALNMAVGVANAIGDIRDGFNSFVTFIRNVPGRIENALSNLFDPLASGFRSAINSVIDGWNSLSFTVPSIDLGALGEVGGFTVSTPNIPRLQTGAFTNGSTLAMLHPDEAILPLTNSNGINALSAAMERALGQLDFSTGQTAGAPPTFIVQIGERELQDIVVTQINDSNRTMLRRARAATGRTA